MRFVYVGAMAVWLIGWLTAFVNVASSAEVQPPVATVPLPGDSIQHGERLEDAWQLFLEVDKHYWQMTIQGQKAIDQTLLMIQELNNVWNSYTLEEQITDPEAVQLNEDIGKLIDIDQILNASKNQFWGQLSFSGGTQGYIPDALARWIEARELYLAGLDLEEAENPAAEGLFIESWNWLQWSISALEYSDSVLNVEENGYVTPQIEALNPISAAYGYPHIVLPDDYQSGYISPPVPE